MFNTANGSWGSKILNFLPSTSNHHPAQCFICRWDEGVDTPTASCPASGSLCYKHILTSLRWRADTSSDNTQPTLRQCFSSGASQSCTRESRNCFPILLGKWSKWDWNSHTADCRRFGNRIPNASQSSISWIGQRWPTQYAFLVSQNCKSFISKRTMEIPSPSYCITGALATLSMPFMQAVHYQGSIILRERSPARNMSDLPRETLM